MRLYVRFIAVAVATYNSAHASSMETPVTPSTTNGTGLLTSGKDIVPVPRLASVAVYDDHEATSLAITKNGDNEERTLATTVDKDDEERAAFVETIASMFSYPKSKVMSLLHAVIAKIKTRSKPSYDVFNEQGDAVDEVKFQPWIKYATYVDIEHPNGEMKAIDFLAEHFWREAEFRKIFEMAQGLKMPGLELTWQKQLIESWLRLKKTPFDLTKKIVGGSSIYYKHFDILDLEVWVNFTEEYLKRNSKGWLDDTTKGNTRVVMYQDVFCVLDAAKKVEGKEDIVKKWQEQQIGIWQELGFSPNVVFRIMGLFDTSQGTSTPYLDRWIKYTERFRLKHEGQLFNFDADVSTLIEHQWLALIEVLKDNGKEEIAEAIMVQKAKHWADKVKRPNDLIKMIGYTKNLDGLLSSPFLLMLDHYLAERNGKLLGDKKTKKTLIDVLRLKYGEPALKESIERVRTKDPTVSAKLISSLAKALEDNPVANRL